MVGIHSSNDNAYVHHHLSLPFVGSNPSNSCCAGCFGFLESQQDLRTFQCHFHNSVGHQASGLTRVATLPSHEIYPIQTLSVEFVMLLAGKVGIGNGEKVGGWVSACWVGLGGGGGV